MRVRIVLSFFLLFASMAACSSLLGDFSVGAHPGDGGSAFDTGVVDARDNGVDATRVQAVTSDVSVYLGQRAVVDASKSKTTLGSLAFSWRVSSAPAGSNVTTSSLTGANSATASFEPDVVGQYLLEFTVRVAGASDTGRATVTAVAPEVLFAEGRTRSQGTGSTRASAHYSIAYLDGGNPHAVVCPQFVGTVWNQAQLAQLAPYAGRAFDYWEAPAGQLSKFAAFTVEYTDDAGFSTHLWAGTSASTCATPPVDLGSAGFGPGAPFGSEPHFSPDGTRFAIFDRQWRIVTYSADGRSAHVVATYPVPYDQASSFLDPPGFDAGVGYVIEPPRVTFVSTGVAWAQPIVAGWEIVTAPDLPNAVSKTYMTCSGVTPREIAMLPNGTVIASYRQTPESSENLYQLKPDAMQRCAQEHQYTALSDSGTASMATDFAVSPDGSLIAFLQFDASLNDPATPTQGGSRLPGGYVYVVPVAGGTPKRLSNSLALYGPRWIAGGTAVVFTRLDAVAPSTGRPATSVVVVSPDGGATQVVAQGDGVNTFVSTSGNATCSAVGGRVGVTLPGRLPMFGLLAAAAAVARRRRRAVPAVRGHA